MTPVEALAALGLSAVDISAYANIGKELRYVLQIAGEMGGGRGINFRFVNEFISRNPGATRAEAAVAYRAAKFFANPWEAIYNLPDEEIIPRNFGREISRAGKEVASTANYRYSVSFDVYFPGNTSPQTFKRWVYSDVRMSSKEIHDRAWKDLLAGWQAESIPVSEGGEGPEIESEWSIEDVVYFTY